MRVVLDVAYLVLGVLTAPVWLVSLIRTGKIRTDWRGRFGRGSALTPPSGARVLVHAVSVGEVNAVRLLVERLAETPGSPDVVISSTTNTGVARATEVFGGTHAVVRYPLDFSFAVGRFLDRVRPDVVVLTELEVWPNFIGACRRRGIRVCIVNGRLTERSARRYGRVRPLIRRLFDAIDAVAVQDEAYAARFRGLGARSCTVTGTMKWDTARIEDEVPEADALADALGIDRRRPLIVAGSTAPGEHELLHAAVPPGVQLLCAPRKPEWFDQAAAALPGCVRRSAGAPGVGADRFLLDTIGELRRAYALADLVVIGRSFGALYGSDMMEPIGLGKATIVGPSVSDFRATVDALLAGDGIVQTDASRLGAVMRGLLDDPERRAALARHGRAVIRAHQGATDRHVALIRSLLPDAGAQVGAEVAGAPTIEVVQADLATLEVDAIVNAANEALRPGGGVCGAIHRAAGPDLAAACAAIGFCATGEAVITPGFDLPARFVIHAVGPVYRDGDASVPRALASCYESALRLADRRGLESIAFPCISTGIYGYPADEAAATALGAIEAWCRGSSRPRRIILCCFSDADADRYRRRLGISRA